MKTKRVPQRICVACRAKKSKFELIRIVKTSDANIVIETDKRVNGRGAYLCKSKECIEQAKQTKLLDRALKAKVTEEIYENLLNLVN